MIIKKKKKRELAVPTDQLKESEKRDMYLNLARQLRKKWNNIDVDDTSVP